MTPPVIAAAIAAVPFVFWFLWRRTRPRPVKGNAAPVPARSASVVVPADTAPLEVPCLPDSSLPVEDPPTALWAVCTAQSRGETITFPSQIEPTIFNPARSEDNPPEVEADEASAMPDEKQSVTVVARAGSQSEAENSTLGVRNATIELLPLLEVASLIETEELTRGGRRRASSVTGSCGSRASERRNWETAE